MFGLTEIDLIKRIISFGDGPASFNFEMTKLNRKVISLDPIYQYSKDEIAQRIAEKSEVLAGIIDYFQTDYKISIDPVAYEFQKGGNRMMKIKRK